MKKKVLLKALSVLVSLTMLVSPVSAFAAETAADDVELESVEETVEEAVSQVEEEVAAAAEDEVVGAASFVTVGGAFETIYATISGVSKVESVSYEATDAEGKSGELSAEDIKYLVRADGSNLRIDIPGVKAGKYVLKVNGITSSEITVRAYDHSGFAHFGDAKVNGGGVGAYKNDGTLKDDAIVLYVTDENKNNVTLSYDDLEVTGIGNILNTVGKDNGTGKNSNGGLANTNGDILKKLGEAGIPLVVRFVGCVSDSGLYKRATFSAASESRIEGLTKYDSTDFGGTVGDNGHMARMRSAKDVTIEGIGTDATLDGWGIHFVCESSAKNLGKSFEVRNLKFINTPEDAIGMEGVQASKNANSEISASVERCWIHNNEFYGPDIANPAESDKGEGDGSCDFKRGQYLTCAYNYFEGCHKTALVGSADYSLQFNLTYHHNYWYMCKARGPLTRRANVHMYNNFVFGQTDYAMNTRADAYIFSESNMFYACKSPQAVEAGAIKSYNDSIASYIQNKGSLGTVVDEKDEYVPNACQYSYGGVKYDKFDTDSSLSYIPGDNYSVDEDLTEARKTIAAYTGVQKEVFETADDMTADDYSIFKIIGSDNVENKGELAVGGEITNAAKSKKAIVFTLKTDADLTIQESGGSVNAVLVNEAGACFGTINAGTTETITGVPAGVYAVQPEGLQPGDSKTLKMLTFKECNIPSIKAAVSTGVPTNAPLTGIKMSKETATMMVGREMTLQAQKVPAKAKDKSETTWVSSNPAVATVSSTGRVTAVDKGTATITATRAGFTATCELTVTEPVYMLGAEIAPSSLNVPVKGSVNIAANAYPANTTDDYEIKYLSADTSVATVDNNGTVKGVKAGTTKVTVTVNVVDEADADEDGNKAIIASYTKECAVNVFAVPVSRIKGTYNYNVTEKGITGDANVSFTSSAVESLSATYESDNYGSLNFSKAAKVQDGTSIKVKAPADGKIVIVTNLAKKKLKIDGTNKTTDDSNILSVDVKAGEHTITKNNTPSIFYIEFIPKTGDPETVYKTAESINLDKTSLNFAKAGDPAQKLTATVVPTAAGEVNSAIDKVTYLSSDPLVAVVDAEGNVSAVGKGTAVITAVSGVNPAVTKECTVTVEADKDIVKVDTVSLSESTLTINKGGETATLTAAIAPAAATYKALRWSTSDSSVVKVSEGTLTAVGKGTATITVRAAADSSKLAVCEVTVLKNADIEKSYSFSSAAFLNSINAWSGKDPFGAMASDGKGLSASYSAKNEYETMVYAEYFKLYKWKIPTTTKSYVGLLSGGNIEITVPNNATITGTFRSAGSSSTTNIALKNAAGVKQTEANGKSSTKNTDTVFTWTNLPEGKYTIAYDNAEIRFSEISVKGYIEAIELEALGLNKETLELENVGDTDTLKPVYTPQNTAYTDVVWTSSNKAVAKVASDGTVTAVGKGTATITCTSKTDKTIFAECSVTVVNGPAVVESVKLDVTSKKFTAAAQELQLTATVLPENAEDKTVTWSTSNPAVATVSDSGLVTAVGEGSAVITAKAGEITAECNVTVELDKDSSSSSSKDSSSSSSKDSSSSSVKDSSSSSVKDSSSSSVKDSSSSSSKDSSSSSSKDNNSSSSAAGGNNTVSSDSIIDTPSAPVIEETKDSENNFNPEVIKKQNSIDTPVTEKLQAVTDDILVSEQNKKFVIKAIDNADHVEPGIHYITLNAGTKYILNDTFEIVSAVNGGELKMDVKAEQKLIKKIATVKVNAKKGITTLTLKAVKRAGSYKLLLRNTAAEDKDAAYIYITIENLQLDKKQQVTAGGKIATFLKTVEGKETTMMSAKWTSGKAAIVTLSSDEAQADPTRQTDISKGKVKATAYVDAKTGRVIVTTAEGSKGSIKLTALMNKKKYNTTIKVVTN